MQKALILAQKTAEETQEAAERKAHTIEKEAKAKAEQEAKEAEEKAKAERLANPTTEDLLKDIKELLAKQVK